MRGRVGRAMGAEALQPGGHRRPSEAISIPDLSRERTKVRKKPPASGDVLHERTKLREKALLTGPPTKLRHALSWALRSAARTLLPPDHRASRAGRPRARCCGR